MNMINHLKTLDRSARQALAKECGVSVGHLHNVAYGYKDVTVELAIRFEAATHGAVRAEDLRPDVPWHVIRGEKGEAA